MFCSNIKVRTNKIYDWYSLVKFSNILSCLVFENIDKVSHLMFIN